MLSYITVLETVRRLQFMDLMGVWFYTYMVDSLKTKAAIYHFIIKKNSEFGVSRPGTAKLLLFKIETERSVTSFDLISFPPIT